MFSKIMRGFIQLPIIILLAIFGLGTIGGAAYIVYDNLPQESEKNISEDSSKQDNILENDDLKAELEQLKKELAQQKVESKSSQQVTVSNTKQEEKVEEVKTFTLSTGVVVDEFGNVVSTPDSLAESNLSEKTISDVVAKAEYSIVLIQTPSGHGSGFFIESGKYVVTNAHVVGNYNYVDLTIDGQTFSGTVLGRDEDADVAVISSGDKYFPALSLGYSSSIRVGDDVLALGFPLVAAPEVTVTRGIISAKYSYYLQTDASIHGGNSGGPLLNMEGEVIGINTLSLLDSQGVGGKGISFAIPIDVAKPLIADLKIGNTNVYLDNSDLPTQGSTIDIPQRIVSSLSINEDLSCSQLFSINDDKVLCEWYRNYYSDYNWNIIN